MLAETREIKLAEKFGHFTEDKEGELKKYLC